MLRRRTLLAVRASLATALACGWLFAGALPALAMPPSPELLQRAAADPDLAARIAQTQAWARARGADAPAGSLAVVPGPDGLPRLMRTPRPETAGEFRTLAIVVDFSDEVAQVTPGFFDDLLFKDVYGRESVRGYYREVSYGTPTERGLIDVMTLDPPSSTGWRRLPQTLAYYAGGQYGLGSYPNNAQKMVEDAVASVDPYVDFSDYDSDADGWVDNVMVIHAGQGAEWTGSTGDIWSHAWGITPQMRDGVWVSSYSTEPEYWASPGDMTVGVYAHEMGHTLGLPDLYDYDGSSEGVGSWSLMASGSWNSLSGSGDCPARLDAWSSMQLDWLQPQLATGVAVRDLPAVGSSRSASAWKVFPDGATSGSQYWLVENRRQTGVDAAIPGSGLLVWHVDETVANNDNEARKLVDVEEAGGVQGMDDPYDYGGPEDPYPGTANNRTFNDASIPNSRLYSGASSDVFVDTISNDGDAMTARIGAMSMSVNNGALYTVSRTVTVYSDAPAAVQMRVDPGTGSFGDWVAYAATYGVTLPEGDGQKTVRVEYRDASMASMGIMTDTIVLDTTGPSVATLTSTSHPDAATWYAEDVARFKWTAASDLSGIAGVSYVFDAVPGTVPDAVVDTTLANIPPYTCPSDGIWYVHVRLLDRAGNWGEASHRAFWVDDTAPELTSLSSATHPGEGTWYGTRDVTFEWAATDALSGVAGVSWTVDRDVNGAPDAVIDTAEESFDASVDGDGLWYAHVAAADVAGGFSDPQTRAVRVDTAAPVTTASVDDGGEYPDSVEIALFADDGGMSGVAETTYRLDGGEPETYDAPFVVDELGEHVLEFASTDAVGNAEEARTVRFSVRAGEVAMVPVEGTDRFGTAVAASLLGFPDGAEKVVIATGRDWPDALGASSLAGALDAPILLVEPGSVPAQVASEIARLGATEAVVIGGTGAVSDAVVAQLRGIGSIASVRRIAGANRYDTALLVGAETVATLSGEFDGTVFVATGEQYADALAASPASAANRWPTLLVPSGGGLPDAVRAFVSANADAAVVLGGTGAVSARTYDELAGMLGAGNVTRLGGADRFETAAMAARWFAGQAGLTYAMPAIATGRSPYDALAGGVAQGRCGSVLLLTETNSLPTATTMELLDNAETITEVRFFGGTGAVSQAVRDSVQMLVGS